jgi:hypothetical protein
MAFFTLTGTLGTPGGTVLYWPETPFSANSKLYDQIPKAIVADADGTLPSTPIAIKDSGVTPYIVEVGGGAQYLVNLSGASGVLQTLLVGLTPITRAKSQTPVETVTGIVHTTVASLDLSGGGLDIDTADGRYAPIGLETRPASAVQLGLVKQGAGVSIAGDGTISTTGPGTGGTVTSVGATAPDGFTVSGSPVTGSGTIDIDYSSDWDAHELVIGPTSGSPTAPTRRTLEASDLPGIPANKINSSWVNYGHGGAVVAGYPVYGASLRLLHVPGVEFNSATTLAQTANQVQYYPVVFDGWTEIDLFSVEVTSAVASSTMRVGLYKADAFWQPTGDIIYGSGTIDTATTGAKTVSLALVDMPPGRYLLASNCSHAITLRALRANKLGGIQTTLGSSPFVHGWHASQTYGALPTTGTLWSNTSGSSSNGLHYCVFARYSNVWVPY